MYFNLFNALLAIFDPTYTVALRRSELRDHAFGDCEVFIEYNGLEIGFGYFGGKHSSLTVMGGHFEGNIAREIRMKIPEGTIERNDSTGPDNFGLGQTMPGLTLEGVLEEITTER